jgi:hypothetical protein
MDNVLVEFENYKFSSRILRIMLIEDVEKCENVIVCTLAK